MRKLKKISKAKQVRRAVGKKMIPIKKKEKPDLPVAVMKRLDSLDLSPAARKKVEKRLQEIPRIRRGGYLTALTGRSRKAAIKSFCLMCVGWEFRRDIRLCTDPSCPLYPFRPFVRR